MIDPISKAILDEIDRYAQEEKVREGKLSYWMRCPACGKRVVKKELLKRGCYVCGWQGAKDEVELLEIVRNGLARKDVQGRKGEAGPYKTNCPRCRTQVITQELMEKGCYICGWKPAKRG